MSLISEIDILRKMKLFMCQCKQKGGRVEVMLVRMEHKVIPQREAK